MPRDDKYTNVVRAPMGGMEYRGRNIAEQGLSRQREMLNTRSRADAAEANAKRTTRSKSRRGGRGGRRK